MEPRHCRICSACIDKRVSTAYLCFPCLASWRVRVGAQQAHRAVTTAIRSGFLAKASTLNCVDCDKPALDWDHRDYNKPLDVVPVCRRCNKLRGPAIPVSVIPANNNCFATLTEQLALDKAVASVKGKTELMRRLNDKGHDIGSHNTISQWRKNGTPAKYCPDIEVVTGVACEELCPGTNWAAIRNASPELALTQKEGA